MDVFQGSGRKRDLFRALSEAPRAYDEHVLQVLNAARINWRFPYLHLGCREDHYYVYPSISRYVGYIETI